MIQNAIRWTGSLVLNRLLSGIWGPSLVALLLAGLLAFGLVALDNAGLSDWLAGFGGALAFDVDGASFHLDALLTVQIAVLTLYFSVTLLILTLGAQSLGTRLIERWIARVTIRASLTQWVALVAFTLLANLFVADGAPVPRATILFDLAATVLALGWLGFGYHSLARTAHVDTTVAELGRTYAADRQDWGLRDGPDPDAEPDARLAAWTSGYIAGFDRDRLIDAAARAGGRIAVRVPDGAFVVEGEPLVSLWGDRDGVLARTFRDTAEISPYRTDRPTGPFSLALLVDIAARALSPGINDYQTAAACADWIGHGLTQRLGKEDAPEGWFTDDAGAARLHVPESGVLLQSRPHLTAFERSALPHPFVVERLLAAYGTALRRATDPRDAARLGDMIDGLLARARDHATPEEAARLDALVARVRRPPAPVTGSLAAE